MDQQEYDYLLKLVLIGDSGVGKSNILSRYTRDEFESDFQPTQGVEFAAKSVNIGDKKVKLQIWDTAGKERSRAITNAYFRGAVGALIVYDITNNDTFQIIEKQLEEIHQHADPGIAITILGNKKDLEQSRTVQTGAALEYAKSKQLGFLETSALSGENINLAFQKMAEEIYERLLKGVTDDGK